jgi:hypothetical protein
MVNSIVARTTQDVRRSIQSFHLFRLYSVYLCFHYIVPSPLTVIAHLPAFLYYDFLTSYMGQVQIVRSQVHVKLSLSKFIFPSP